MTWWAKKKNGNISLVVIPAQAGIQKKVKLDCPIYLDSGIIKELDTGLRRYDDKNYEEQTN
jgi:hypothetical protein